MSNCHWNDGNKVSDNDIDDDIDGSNDGNEILVMFMCCHTMVLLLLSTLTLAIRSISVIASNVFLSPPPSPIYMFISTINQKKADALKNDVIKNKHLNYPMKYKDDDVDK